ncbi:MAG: hypothetical protein MUC36_22475 [Planctomycetes bacterium]|jgi:hypothetical protein|nr:hypothetical protein [Planctomycetota bacterium]
MTPIRILLPALLSSALLAQGKIVVAHDDWTLGTQGFTNAPSAAQFVQNVAAWFHGGQPGNFRAWTTSTFLANTSVSNAMTAAGHTWTASSTGSFTLANLQQYDGVFVVGNPVNANVLAQYVANGGNVYVAAGTSASPANLNPFLEQFGMTFGPVNPFVGTWPISSPHPIFAGVSSLYHFNGNSISFTANAGAGAQVLVTKNGLGLYAAYDGSVGPMAKNTGLGAGCNNLSLAATSRPLLGQNWSLACSGINPTSLLGIEVFGSSDPGIDDLLAIGMAGCGTRASLDVLIGFSITGSTHAYSLAIPVDPSLNGLDLFSTTVVFPSTPPNPFGAITSNGMHGRIGSI